jgi:hypothetical protein
MRDLKKGPVKLLFIGRVGIIETLKALLEDKRFDS